MDKRGKGYQDFASKIFCLTVPKFSVWGESFSVSLNSGVEKICIRVGEGGEYQEFPSKIFCLTVPKVSVGGILQCFMNFGCRSS